eukprot:Colp12_sorted_trinity150504_noHs@9878
MLSFRKAVASLTVTLPKSLFSKHLTRPRTVGFQFFFQRKLSKMAPSVDSRYIIPKATTVNRLECKTAFDGLTAKEKAYAHYLSRASYEGSLAVLTQTSPEAP